MTSLPDLISRIERGPITRELNDEVLLAHGYMRREGKSYWELPDGSYVLAMNAPLDNLQDAVDMLPEGALWVVGSMELGPFASVILPKDDGSYIGQKRHQGEHENPAAALSAATLKAVAGSAA